MFVLQDWVVSVGNLDQVYQLPVLLRRLNIYNPMKPEVRYFLFHSYPRIYPGCLELF